MACGVSILGVRACDSARSRLGVARVAARWVKSGNAQVTFNGAACLLLIYKLKIMLANGNTLVYHSTTGPVQAEARFGRMVALVRIKGTTRHWADRVGIIIPEYI